MTIGMDYLRSGLRKATLLFLATPLVVFFGGWLRWPFAAVVCFPLCAALWRGVRRPMDRRDGRTFSLPRLVAATLPPAAMLTLLSGAGGWGGGDSDWLKHDTLLRDLISRPWPVTYETARGPVLLVYYLAFYLPAAMVGKLAGSSGLWVGREMLALTTLAGTVLAALWLIVLGAAGREQADDAVPDGKSGRGAGGAWWIGAAVFFGFSGLDVLGKGLVNLYLRLPASSGEWYDIEWWAQFAQYSSNAATLFWAPQHAFGGWLPLALALDDWFCHRKRLEESWVLYVALALVWSPFAALGLGALLGGLFLCDWMQASLSENTQRRRGWIKNFAKGSLTLTNGAGALTGGFFLAYLSAHFQSYDLPEAYRVTPGRLPLPLLEDQHLPFLALYVPFVAVEFAGLSLALALFFRREAGELSGDHFGQPEWPLLISATLILLGLPFLHYGYANDLVMRGGIPALFGLQVLLVRMFSAQHALASPPRRAAVVLAAVLLTGGLVNVGIEYRRHVVRMVRQGSWRDARTREPVRTLAELQRTIYARPGFDFARQYLGSNDSFFARHLARRKTPSTGARDLDF